MKKLLLGIIVLFMGLTGFTGFKFHQNAFSKMEYYVKVPSNVETSIETWNERIFTITGRRYEFVGINEEGQERLLKIAVTDDDKTISEKDLLQAGQYVLIVALKNKVLDYEVINQNEVPTIVLNNLK